jgi:prepilin-type N-terminal cleavage/methylation domain-containing protein
MKTNTDRLQIDFENKAVRPVSTQNSKLKIQNRPAFTLVELLVVIAIIAVLAALLMPLGAAVKRTALLNRTKAEMAQMETAPMVFIRPTIRASRGSTSFTMN